MGKAIAYQPSASALHPPAAKKPAAMPKADYRLWTFEPHRHPPAILSVDWREGIVSVTKSLCISIDLVSNNLAYKQLHSKSN